MSASHAKPIRTWIAYSVMRARWFLLFGRNVETASVLGTFGTKREAQAELDRITRKEG